VLKTGLTSIHNLPDLRLGQLETQGQLWDIRAVKKVADFPVPVLSVNGFVRWDSYPEAAEFGNNHVDAFFGSALVKSLGDSPEQLKYHV